MGGSGSRSAQELHRSPPCTRFQCPDPPRRQSRPAVGSPKWRHVPPSPQQQCRRLAVQKNPPLRKEEVVAGRLRAGCETFQGYGDAPWTTAQVAYVKPQEDAGRQRGLQCGDGLFSWKSESEMAMLTAVKQRVEKLAPVPRPRSPRQPDSPGVARKGVTQAFGYVVERCPAAPWPPPAPPPPPPPPEPPPPAAIAALRLAAGPRPRACREVSASYAGSSTSSRSSLAPNDSGISSSASRVSIKNRRENCEEEMFAEPQSPRPPAWRVRGFREDQIPSDLHRRFCEEIKSHHRLLTEEDRRRRLRAIRQIDSMISERMASCHGREVPLPHCSLRQRPESFSATSGNQGEGRSNSSDPRSHFSSSAVEGKSGNTGGRTSTPSGRDDAAILRRPLLDQYPKNMLTDGYTDRLQQEAEKNQYRSLNDANIHQLPENYSLESSQEHLRTCDIFFKKSTMKTVKDDAHKTNMCLKEIGSVRDKQNMVNVWGNSRGETESINRPVEVPECQRMISRTYGQNEKESIIVGRWYTEKLHRQEENEPDNILLQVGQWDQNVVKHHGTETPQRNLQQPGSRYAEQGKVLVQNSATSGLAGSTLRNKDNMVMQLLLGGYFSHEHYQPGWPRVAAVRRTTNQLDVSIRTCKDPVEKQSVETQTLPVNVSKRMPNQDDEQVQLFPKIEIDHRGSFTRYHSLGREGSVGSMAFSSTPRSARRQPTAADDEERTPCYLVPGMSTPPPLPPPPLRCASQHSRSDDSSNDRRPNAQWISPEPPFMSSRNNRDSSMQQSLATHMSGNSANYSRTLRPEPEVNNGSYYRNTVSKSTLPRNSADRGREDYEAVENKQGRKSVWSLKTANMSYSTLHKIPVNEARVKTDQPFSVKKNSIENSNMTHRLGVSDTRPLTSEEEPGYTRVMSNQYCCRVPLDDPPGNFPVAGKGRSMQYSTPYGDELQHSVEHWGEDESKQQPEHGMEKTCRRFGPSNPWHSRHHRNRSRRAKHEEKFAESDSESEERTTQHNIALQSLRRVTEDTGLSKCCLGKNSFDSVGNVKSGATGDGKSHFRPNASSNRIVRDEGEEENSDDAQLLIGSTEQSSDNLSKSSVSLLCQYCREQEQGTSFDRCKFIPARKKVEKRDSRRSVDQSPSRATLKQPSATFVRKADSRVKRDTDLEDEDVPHCRSSCCCCTCYKPPRLQPDVSGRRAAQVAKCSGTASALDTSWRCRDQQSVECGAGGRGLCSACQREARSRGVGPMSERRSSHDCFCSSRRVCYSILEDEEEAAAAEEAQGGACGFAHAHASFRSRNTDQWSQ